MKLKNKIQFIKLIQIKIIIIKRAWNKPYREKPEGIL